MKIVSTSSRGSLMAKMKIRKGEQVQMLHGKDRGKRGRVIEAEPGKGRVIVENLNVIKAIRARGRSRTRAEMGGTQMAPGGVMERKRSAGLVRDARLPDVPARHAGRHEQQGDQGREGQGAPVQARADCREEIRPVTNGNGYTPRLKQFYRDQLCGQLKDELGLSTVSGYPPRGESHAEHGRRRGQDRGEGARQRDRGTDAHRWAARAQVRRCASRSPASRSARGCRSVRVALCAAIACTTSSTASSRSPSRASATGGPTRLLDAGNYSLGIREQIIFPEIDYDDISSIRGLDVAVTTTATTDEQDRAAARIWVPVRRPAARRTGVRNGKEVTDRQSSSHAAVPGAEVLAVQPLRPAAGGLQEAWALPDLPAGTRPRGVIPGMTKSSW